MIKKFTTRVMKVKVNELKVSSYLKNYGIATMPDFIINQMKKFDLKPDQIIVTKDNIVIHNAEALEQAKKLKLKEVEVTVINELEEDEIIQVTTFKNMDKKVKRRDVAEIIQELVDYMTNDKKGKIWKDEIPGSRINDKVSFLIGKSYGTVYSIREIYKYNTDLLDKIDNGTITIKEAEEEIERLKMNMQAELYGNGNNDGERNESVLDNEHEGCSNCNNENNGDKDDAKVKKKPNRLAGEKNMVECEPLVAIQFIYKSGKSNYLIADGSQACLECDGIVIRDYIYESHLIHPDDGSEIHTFVTEKDKNLIQLSIVNRGGITYVNKKAA